MNSGPQASNELMKLVQKTNIPVTTTLHGLGCYPGEDPKSLAMLGMHGTYEANLAMNECDLMINVGARFDDRVTGRLDAFLQTLLNFILILTKVQSIKMSKWITIQILILHSP